MRPNEGSRKSDQHRASSAIIGDARDSATQVERP